MFPRVTVKIRGIPRVSAASVMAHDTSTVNATVVSTARAAALSVANSVVPTMATHGIPRQLPRKFPLRRTSVVIATATRQSPQMSAEVRRNFYGCFRRLPRTSKCSKLHENPRHSAAIAMAQISQVRQNHGRTRKSAVIATAVPRTSADVQTQQVPGHPRPLPWQISDA